MPRLFLGNFYFEHELAAPPAWKPTASMSRIAAERASLWIAIADEGDFIVTPEPIEAEFWKKLASHGLPRVTTVSHPDQCDAKDCTLVPWGWSPQVRALSATTPQPGDSSVRQGNSRAWSFALEQELGVALPGAARLTRVEDLGGLVARSASVWDEVVDEHRWVIKANFGMAARERLLGRGSQLSESSNRWLQRRLAADGAVFFEPWRPRRDEVGIQWEIPQPGGGSPQWMGVTPLFTGPGGEYRGSEFSWLESIPPHWEHAVAVTEQVAVRLQQLGYFGPLGIDAAIYEAANGHTIERPLQDINARFTMGRLALGLRRRLRPNEQGLWWHGRADETPPTLEGTTREIPFAPKLVGSRPPTHVSRLLIRRSA